MRSEVMQTCSQSSTKRTQSLRIYDGDEIDSSREEEK